LRESAREEAKRLGVTVSALIASLITERPANA
jgi:hypothetical protein